MRHSRGRRSPASGSVGKAACLAVNGRDLRRLGVEPGPRMGQILRALLNCVLNDPSCNSRDHLFEIVQAKFPDAFS